MDDKYRKELACELKSAVLLLEDRAVTMRQAESAYIQAKSRVQDAIWKLEHAKVPS